MLTEGTELENLVAPVVVLSPPVNCGPVGGRKWLGAFGLMLEVLIKGFEAIHCLLLQRSFIAFFVLFQCSPEG